MNKELIMDIRPWNKDFVTAALEAGVTKIIIPQGKTEDAHELGKITTISEDGDLKLGTDIIETQLKDKNDEERVINLSKKADIIVQTSNWKIIPLENLVSKSDNIFTSAKVDEIETMLGVLEKGVKGVVIKPESIKDITAAVTAMKTSGETLELVEAEVTEEKVLGSGERACIDTCTTMDLDEGMLVGSSSNFLFLVHAESVEAAYCDTRPFRVNAGGIASYALLPNNKTKYLSEIKPGDEVLIVTGKGKTQSAIVGRNKIEERPLVLVEAIANGKTSSVILQNAETIRLITPGKKYISVSKLKKGDKILVRLDNIGRHFGQAIEENIKE